MFKAFSVTILFALGLGLAGAGVAHAVPTGAAILNIENGVFANDGTTQTATADFTFTNTLPGADALSSYRVSALIEVGGLGTVFDQTLDLGLASLNGLLATPAGVAAQNAFNFVLANNPGTIQFDTGLGVILDYDYIINFDPGSSLAGASGDFALESNINYNDLLIANGVTAAAATFSAVFAIEAVPVPAAAPLMASAIGLFGVAAWRRKRPAKA